MNTQSVPPAGGSQALAGANTVGGPQKGARPPLRAEDTAKMEKFMANQVQIAELTAEQVSLIQEIPGVVSSDVMPRNERHAWADSDFRVDRIPHDLLCEFMSRILKGKVIPAYLLEHEAQLVFAMRAISHGSFGEIHVVTSEKRRVKIAVTINGR